MAQTRSATSAGHTIPLVINIHNSAGDLAVPSGIDCYIFEPEVDTTDLSLAFATPTPSTPHTGVYVVDYPIPATGVDGYWHDKWVCALDNQVMMQTFEFLVTNSGEVSFTQLYPNNEVTITLDADLPAADGDTLETDYSFYFTTEFTPLYTNYNQLQLDIGRFMESSVVPADTVWRAILSASLEADDRSLVSPPNTARTTWHAFARRMWTRCRAEETVLHAALRDFDVKSKQLGDLAVTWNPQQLMTALEKALACMEEWLPALESGGVKIKRMDTFIKGELDFDRPEFGRDWLSTSSQYGDGAIPAKNVRYRSPYSSRFRGTYLKRG